MWPSKSEPKSKNLNSNEGDNMDNGKDSGD